MVAAIGGPAGFATGALTAAAFAATAGLAVGATAAGVAIVETLEAAAPSRSWTLGSPAGGVDIASLTVAGEAPTERAAAAAAAAVAVAGAGVAGSGPPLTRAVILETASVAFDTATTETSTVLPS